MAADAAAATTSSAEDALEALLREAEALKQKLEEERQKLNDVTLASVAERLEPINFPNLKLRRVLKGHQSKVLCCDWSPDKRHLVSSSQDGKVIVWDAFTAQREACLALPSTWLLAVAYSPSGALLAAGGLDNKVSVLAPAEDARRRTVATTAGYVAAALWARSDRQLLSAAGDGSVALWDVESAQLLAAWAGEGAALALALGGDELFAAGAGRAAVLRDLRAPRPVQRFAAHDADVTALRFHPAGDALATGCDDAACRLFDLRADREVARYSKESLLFGVNSVEWSLSGRLLFAAYSDHTAAAWDALRARRLAVLCGHEHRVACARLAGDGAALATASWDHTVRVWA